MPENISGVKFILRALRYRNYRLFFAGQGVSLTGSWMQVMTVSWLAYRLSGSAFLLGLIGFTSQAPILFLAPFAGILADRQNRKNIVLVTQALAMIQAFILAALTIAGTITIRHIIVLSTFIGLVNAFDMPVRQAFIADMIEDKKDLGNAIALNSMIFNGARMIGASLAGILIAAVGEGACFLFNGASFLAVIFALLAMRIRPLNSKARRGDIFQDLKSGIAYIFGFAAIRHVLLLVSLVSLMGVSFMVVMPIIAKDILGGGARTLGFLMGAAGLGAVCGTIYVASMEGTKGAFGVIARATVVFGAALIAFSFSRSLWLSLVLVMCAGFGLMVQTVSCNTVLQSLTDDDKRGRVMSFYTIAFIGMMPLGSLLAGSLAGRLGAPAALFVSGASCILGGALFAAKSAVLMKKGAGNLFA